MDVKPGYKLTEVGVIPEDWDIGTLSEITDVQRPISYGIVQTGKYLEDGVRCVRVIDINEGRILAQNLIRTTKEISDSYRRTILKEGDLIVALRGKIGELAIVEKELEGANLTRGVALIAVSRHYDAQYLLQYLSSPASKSIFGKNLNGSALQEIPIGTLKRIPVILPSLPEQRAIAAALSDVDALLASLDALIAKKRDIKQTAMQQLLTGRRRLPGFEGEWEVKRLGDVFQFLKTANNSRSDLSNNGDVGYIHYGDIHTNPNAFCDCSIEQLPMIDVRKVKNIPFLEDGDLVMVDASEDYAGVGKSIEVSNATGRRIVAGLHTFLLRSSGSDIAYGFGGYLQFIPSLKDALTKAATGISVYGVSKNHVRNIEVLLPPPDEQTAIAAVLSDMDAEIAALEARRAKAAALKQGMMQELLTGKTRLV